MGPSNFPSHWRVTKFSEVAHYALGRTPPRNVTRYWQAGQYPWVSIADMQEYGLICRTKEAVSSDAYQEIFRGRLVPAGTLLMSFKLTIGRVSILGIHAFHNEAIISIYPKSEVDRDFLMFYLPTINFSDHQDRAVKGNTLNKSKINELPIPLPPLSEQRAIARALRTVQEAKEARQRELELERERKAALMQHLFTHGTRGEPLKETEIGLMPESWRVVRLGELVIVRGGKRLPKGAPFADHPTSHPYIRVVDFRNGTVETTGLKYLSPEVQTQISRYTIGKEDVYISIAGTIGLVGTIPEELDGANLTENAAKLVIKEHTRLSHKFLARYLASERGQIQIDNLTAKTTQPKLALAKIEQIRLPLPDIDEQHVIVDVLQACDTKLEALKQESALLDELFRAMLEELMTGRLSALPLVEGETPP